MITLDVVQGSPAWFAARSAHGVRTASDAPAMMGVSKHKSRTRLIDEKRTGIADAVNDAQQSIFDAGHAAEAAARPMAEAILGTELYPITAVTDDGIFLASLDGMTFDGLMIFEHKLWNDSLAESVRNGIVPESHIWQIAHQFMVCDEASECLFMVSDGTPENCVHCIVRRDEDRIATLRAGWEQFERDLADYKPEAVTTKPAGRSPETLPALRIEAKGMVTASNMAEFREHAMAVLGQINRDLQTDDDFANAESTVKWCSGVEDRLSAAKANVLAQMADVDAVCRTIDDVAAETRRIRLELDKLVKAEKENRKAQIVQAGVESIREHYATINANLGQYALHPHPALQSELGAAIKGLKTLTSMREKVDAAVALAKINASLGAELARTKMAIIDEHKEHAHLFPDMIRLCIDKSPEDLRNLITARIAEHKAREEAKLEAERQRIRAEEQAKAERAAREELEKQRAAEDARIAAEAKAHEKPLPPVTMTVVQPQAFVAPVQPAAQPSSRTIKLGDINAALAPLSITAEGLASIGFPSCGQDRAAKLYRADDLPAILRTLAHRLHMAAQSGVAA